MAIDIILQNMMKKSLVVVQGGPFGVFLLDSWPRGVTTLYLLGFL